MQDIPLNLRRILYMQLMVNANIEWGTNIYNFDSTHKIYGA